MPSSTRLAVAALAVAVTITACSSSSKSSSPAVSTSTSTTSAAATTPTTTAATAVPSSPAFAQLAARIITTVPAGFALQADSVGDTGPSNLAKAVKDDGSAGAQKALTVEGFVRGYQRLWVGPAQAEIIVFLYQFASPGGARQDYVRGTEQYSGTPPPGVHVNKFSTGLATAQSLGIAGTGQGNDGAAAVIYFTTGVYNVQINCVGPTLPGLQARVTALAEDQLSRLRP